MGHSVMRLKELGWRAAASVYRAYYATLRVEWLLPDNTIVRPSAYAMDGKIFALCERDGFALGGLLAGRGFAVLVAPGRDGDWASALLTGLGCQVIRGSSLRGGARALLAAVRQMRATSAPAAIVVDGPLGPDCVAKPGAVACSIKSGRPLLALGVAAGRRLRLPNTWSGIYLPLPFSSIAIAAMPATPANTGADIAEHTRALTGHLRAARTRAGIVQLARRGRRRWIGTVVRGVGAVLVVARDALLAAIVVPTLLPLWFLPWTAALALGRFYGYLAGAAWPHGRRVGMINLQRAQAFTLTRHQARRAIRAVFGSLGQSIAEGIQVARWFKGTDGAWRSLYECEDPALSHRILADPRPKIFVTGHLGSWEVAARLAALSTGQPGAVVVRRVDNLFLNALWRRVRVRDGTEWIEKRGAASQALARLRRGENVAMLLDENAGPRGVFVPFLGTLASTNKTAAVLSLATGAPIVVGACIRRPGQPFLFRLAIVEPDQTRPPSDSIRAITAAVVSVYESWVREAPLQWRWIHWRWKARPDGSEERYGRAELAHAFDRPTRGRVAL